MGSILKDIKEIEDKGIEHTEGQVGFFFTSCSVEMTLEDMTPLKKVLTEHKIIGEDDNVSLVKLEDPDSDIRAVCKEYYVSPDLAERFIGVIKEADDYYKVWADGFYEKTGYLWSDCRVVCKDSEYVLLEFYICD